MTNLNEQKWSAEEILTMACAVFRTKGFTSTSTFTSSDPESDARWTSKEHLCYQIIPTIASKDYKILIKVTKDDSDMAQDIIKHYRKLSFGVIADNITEYMQRVFATTQNSEVSFKDFGVLASVPSVYSREIAKKRILDEAKKTKQEHLGEIGQTVELEIRYINTKFVEKLNCYAHEAVTSTNYLVNFLNKNQLGKVGETQNIRAKVKGHGVNYTTKTAETQLNYVKVVDNMLVWQ